MAFLADEQQTLAKVYWWQDLAVAIEPIFETVKKSSAGLTQSELQDNLDRIHHAYVTAHRVNMPMTIKAQLIAAICNLQISFDARHAGETRTSAKHHRIAQVEWVLFQEMLGQEGINCNVLH